MRHLSLTIALLLGLSGASAAYAHADAANGSMAITAQQTFGASIPNIPGKSLKVVEVTFAPGAIDGPHHHAKSAFIYAQVLEGAISSQVDGQPARIYRAGEHFTEQPGAHHVASGNASKTRPAKLLAVFVVDTDDTVLTTHDMK